MEIIAVVVVEIIGAVAVVEAVAVEPSSAEIAAVQTMGSLNVLPDSAKPVGVGVMMVGVETARTFDYMTLKAYKLDQGTLTWMASCVEKSMT